MYMYCITGRCDAKNDSRVTDAVFYLIKLGEHTWGLPSLGDTVNWTNHAFYLAKSGKVLLCMITQKIIPHMFKGLLIVHTSVTLFTRCSLFTMMCDHWEYV